MDVTRKKRTKDYTLQKIHDKLTIMKLFGENTQMDKERVQEILHELGYIVPLRLDTTSAAWPGEDLNNLSTNAFQEVNPLLYRISLEVPVLWIFSYNSYDEYVTGIDYGVLNTNNTDVYHFKNKKDAVYIKLKLL